jgi:hypothetical protein
MSCADIRESVSSLCCHSQMIQIPSSKVDELRRKFEETEAGMNGHVRRQTR